MAHHTHNVNVQVRLPGFFSRFFAQIGDKLGYVVGVLIALAIGLLVIAKTVAFIWPTFTWLIPGLVILAITTLVLYKAYTMPHGEAIPFFEHKATVLAARIIFVIILLLADIKNVP